MTTVVTGATGHIGNNLVRALLARGERVRASYLGDAAALDGLDVEHVPGDVTDARHVARLLEGAERVFHLAAVISVDGDRDGQVRRVNVEGAANVAEAALEQGVRRLVHCCSVHAFQRPPGDQRLDEAHPRVPAVGGPYGAYDRSKAAGEAAVRSVVARGLDAVIVHPTGVIGPYDHRPSRMGAMLRDLRDGKYPAIVDGGFNWVDVRDVASALIAAAEHGKRGESYLVSGRWESIVTLAGYAREATGARVPQRAVPRWLARGAAPFAVAHARLTRAEPLLTGEMVDALGAYRHVDGSKAERELGHQSRPARDSVLDAYAWFDAHGM